MNYIDDYDICNAALLSMFMTLHYQIACHYEMAGNDKLSYVILLLNVLIILHEI